MESLVSIIIPVFNTEKYLSTCVNSVIQQTYKNLEIILIDDGSTDRSGVICDQYAEADKRIKVIHKDNEGLGLSRNVGIRFCKGEYLMFLDSDDYIDPDMIKEMLRICQKYQADLCITGFYRVSEDGSVIACRKYHEEIFDTAQVKSNLLPRMIGSKPDQKDAVYSMAWGKLYSTVSIKSSHAFFQSERIVKAEDIAFQIDYLSNVKKAVISEKCFYRHRENSGSITVINRKDHLQDSVIFYQYVVNKINSLKLGSEALLRAEDMFLSHILAGLKMELPEVSHSSYKKCYERIGEYVDNIVVQKVLTAYPVSKADRSRKIYYSLLRKKKRLLLILLLEGLHKRDQIREQLPKHKKK